MTAWFKRTLIYLIVILLVLEPGIAAAAGGIIVAPGAPASKQPTLDAAPNGVTIINIVKPSASGLSHNQFDQFNVNSQGVIINNSLKPGVSQLGGAIAGNANFAGGAEARTILNEVTGSSRSSIEGYTEIFGFAANYILANPNGVTVNGGGFINTPKATLTTGAPRLDGTGALLGLDVRRGDVLVEGLGINAGNIDAFEIVSRTAKINAEIHAKRLNIIAGQGSYDPATEQATSLTPDGSPAPGVSLDSTALGGMYADRIKLVGTEAGVGVNLVGLTQATEELTLTAAGRVELKGTVSSGKNLSVGSTGNSVVVSGKVLAKETATLTALNEVEIAAPAPAPAEAPVVKGNSVAIDAGSLNNKSMILADSTFDIATHAGVLNTGTIYSGGTGLFRVGGTLLNNRGSIYTQGDLGFAGYGAGQRMLKFQNDSGNVESLQGKIDIKATSVLNNNLDFVLAEGAIPGTTLEGGLHTFGNDVWGVSPIFSWATGHAPTGLFSWNASRIYIPYVNSLGLNSARNVFSLAELTTAVSKAEQELLATPDATRQANVNWVKSNIIAAHAPYAVLIPGGRGEIAVYEAKTTTDLATGTDKGASLAARTGITITGDDVKNNVSKISTATGDIIVNAGTFENVGKEIYERSTVKWGRGYTNNSKNKGVYSEGTGQEILLTPVSYAYGTLDAGNTVNISATHVANGIVERKGIVLPPDPATQQQKVQDVSTVIGALPQSGLFQTNPAPGHHFLVETNPALTNMGTFYGSDYFLSHAGIDLDKTHQQLLGDAFYETQLVRGQIFALTGKRLLSSSATGDAEQMQELMDSALRAKASLELTVGVALSKAQIASLTENIVWLEKRTVEGHEVLVPTVYLASASLEKIAQGGSVIVGKNVALTTTGDTINGGLIQAANSLTINADNIFNTFGSMQGQTVALAATGSIANTSGHISGGDVTLAAGKNITVDTATTTFASRDTTSVVANQRGSITSTGALTMAAGDTLALVGADVSAGGSANLSAGKDVIVTAQQTSSNTATSGTGFRFSSSRVDNQAATLTSGGALTVAAGQDVLINGSTVQAGGDTTLTAGRNLSITAATDSNEGSASHNSKGGGLFGGKSSESYSFSQTTNVASQVTSGGKLTAEAGKAGTGDLVVAGSKLASGGDMSLKATDELVVASVQNTSSSSFSSSNKDTWSSKTLDKNASSATVVKSELTSGGDMGLESSDGGVTIKASKLESDGGVRIESKIGDVAMLTDTSSTYSQEKKSGSNVVWQSSRDKGAADQTVEHTEITAKGVIQVLAAGGIRVEYRDTGNVNDSITQLAKQPGLAWMDQLRGDPKVNWQAVAEAHQNWDYKSEGLTGAGAALLSLAVAVATSGWGASLAASLPASLTSSLGVTGSAMAASAVQAGFASLCSQAAVSLVNNKGDMLAVLKDLASDQGMRALASAMLTASLTSGLTTELAKYEGIKEAVKAGGLAGKVTQDAVINGTVQAGVGTALYGGDLGQNLLDGLRGAAVSSLGAKAANEIGAAYRDKNIDYVVHKIAHAALGGAIAAANGDDAASGALGAVVGEVTAEQFVKRFINDQLEDPAKLKNLTPKEQEQYCKDVDQLKQRGVDLSKLSAGLAAALVGGDVNTAAQTGGNAAQNNAVVVVPIMLELVDKGLQAYDALRLAKAIDAGNHEEALDIAQEISIGLATDAIPGNVILAKIGITLNKFGLVGLGGTLLRKLGGDAVEAGQSLQTISDSLNTLKSMVPTLGLRVPPSTKSWPQNFWKM